MSIDPTTTHEDGNPAVPARSKKRRGQTIVKSKALLRVAGQVTADTLGVSAKNVKVSIHDDDSRLGLSVETPLSEADMLRCSIRPDMTVFSLCENARHTISERAAHITGHNIGDVNVVIAGIEKEPDNDRRVQ